MPTMSKEHVGHTPIHPKIDALKRERKTLGRTYGNLFDYAEKGFNIGNDLLKKGDLDNAQEAFF